MLQWILQNALENQAFRRKANFIEMKGVTILGKADKMCNILKILLAAGYWSRYEARTFKLVNAFSTCFVFVRVAANHRRIICNRNRWRIPEHIVTDVSVFILLYLECT